MYGEGVAATTDELFIDVAELFTQLSADWRLRARRLSADLAGEAGELTGLVALAWIRAPRLTLLLGVAKAETFVQVSVSSHLERLRLWLRVTLA